MEFPKILTKQANFGCEHTVQLVRTVHNEDEEEYFVYWTHELELCPECCAANATRYRDVYNAIDNPRYHGYTILFKRLMPVWRCSTLFKERIVNKDKDRGGSHYRSTKFLVEHDINRPNERALVPIGLYRNRPFMNPDNHGPELEDSEFVPFRGYTVEYMKFLLRHDREALEAEAALESANVWPTLTEIYETDEGLEI